jgi:hypothetical protein
MVASVMCAGDIVLIDVAAGRRLTLDPFGSRIWSLLADQPALTTLAERLRGEGHDEQLLSDLVPLLAAWCEKGLVTWR